MSVFQDGQSTSYETFQVRHLDCITQTVDKILGQVRNECWIPPSSSWHVRIGKKACKTGKLLWLQLLSQPTSKEHYSWRQGIYLMGKHSRLLLVENALSPRLLAASGWSPSSYCKAGVYHLWQILQDAQVGVKCFLLLCRVKVWLPALSLPCYQGNPSSFCHVLSGHCILTGLSSMPPRARLHASTRSCLLDSSLVQDRSNALFCLICTLGEVQAVLLMQLRVSVKLFLFSARLVLIIVNSWFTCLICILWIPLISKRAVGSSMTICIVSSLL